MDDRSYQALVDKIFNGLIAANYQPIELQSLKSVAIYAINTKYPR